MAENNNPKPSKIVKKLNGNISLVSFGIVIALFTAVLGWMLFRIEKAETKADKADTRVSGVEGDIKTIRETMRWLENLKDEYKKKNGGTFNLRSFLGTISASYKE